MERRRRRDRRERGMGMGGRDVGGLSLKWIDAVSPSSLFRAEFEAMPEDRVFPEGKVENYGRGRCGKALP